MADSSLLRWAIKINLPRLTDAHVSMTGDGRWTQVELPEVSTINEEQAHHHAIQQEHTGNVEICRITQA